MAGSGAQLFTAVSLVGSSSDLLMQFLCNFTCDCSGKVAGSGTQLFTAVLLVGSSSDLLMQFLCNCMCDCSGEGGG